MTNKLTPKQEYERATPHNPESVDHNKELAESGERQNWQFIRAIFAIVLACLTGWGLAYSVYYIFS